MHKLVEIYNKINHFGTDNNMDLNVISPGHVEYLMEIQKKHLATPIAAHGGVIAALMDGLLGVAALSKTAYDLNLVSTVEFKINYLNPAFLGVKLKGVGKVIRSGKKILVCQGDIYEVETNKHIATATGTFNAYPYQKAGIPEIESWMK